MVAVAPQQNAPSKRFSLAEAARPKAIKPPPRLVVVGEPGIGKTSFGASAPGVILIPTEDGALAVDVPRLPTDGKCQSADDVLSALRVLASEEHSYKWVAIDTANGVVKLFADKVCGRDFGGHWTTTKGKEGYDAYGKGDKATAQELREFLGLLDYLQQKRGMGVILLTHVGLHKQGNALGADFMKFAGEMDKNSWSLLCQWADQVAHACRELRATTREGERKAKADAVGQERWLVFEGGPGRDAKARVGYEMPERILLSWEEYEKALGADPIELLASQAVALAAKVPANIKEALTAKLGGTVTAESLKAIGKSKLATVVGWLLQWSQQQQQQGE